jgi:hypothetical protein
MYMNSNEFKNKYLKYKTKYLNLMKQQNVISGGGGGEDEDYEFYSSFGTQGNGNGQLNDPQYAIQLKNNNFAVCDCTNNRIQIFDQHGNYINKFGIKGTGDGEFNDPFGITQLNNGNLAVCDQNNNRIQIFSLSDASSCFVSKFNTDNLNGVFTVTQLENDDFAMCDTENDRIKIFDSSGNFMNEFGSELRGPIEIIQLTNNDLAVCDSKNHCIKIFDTLGNYKSKFGVMGRNDGELFNPTGITQLHNENLAVCDSGNSRVQIFSSSGIFINKFGKNGRKDGEFSYPGNITKLFDGNLAVCDTNNNRIQIFKQSKPDELKSVKVKQQLAGDCWAHTGARNFVRTFQILDIIKSEYIDNFYDLFYEILTTDKDCEGGASYNELYKLLNYLDKKREDIFNVRYKSKCIEAYCKLEDLGEIILKNINEEDKIKIIDDLNYLFDNNLLFVSVYTYDVDMDKNNKPSKAIKTMLNYKLQPLVGFNISIYFEKNYNKEKISAMSVSNISNHDKECNSTSNNNSSGHAVNLRKWTKDGIEFKNSWGTNFAHKDGNFIVKDLNYLVCKNKREIIFSSLMFDYNKFDEKYKKKVDEKILKYYSTFDDDLETEESHNYEGDYNEYGLMDGYGDIIYDNDKMSFQGQWKNGVKINGILKNYETDISYEGELRNDEAHGKGKITFSDDTFYEGEWKNNVRNGEGKMTYSNGSVYEGEWKDDVPLIKNNIDDPEKITMKDRIAFFNKKSKKWVLLS